MRVIFEHVSPDKRREDRMVVDINDAFQSTTAIRFSSNAWGTASSIACWISWLGGASLWVYDSILGNGAGTLH